MKSRCLVMGLALGALIAQGCDNSASETEPPVQMEPEAQVDVALLMESVHNNGDALTVTLRLFASEATSVEVSASWSQDGQSFEAFAQPLAQSPLDATPEGTTHQFALDLEGVSPGQTFIRAQPVIEDNIGDTMAVFVQPALQNLDLVDERYPQIHEEINDAFATIGIGLDDIAQPKRVNGELAYQADVGTMSPVVDRLQDPLGGPADLQVRARAALGGCGSLAQNVSQVGLWRQEEVFEMPPRAFDPLSQTPLMDALDAVYGASGQSVPEREALAQEVAAWPTALRQALAELVAAAAAASQEIEAANTGVDRDSERAEVAAIIEEVGPSFDRFGRLVDRLTEDPPAELHSGHLQAAWRMASAVDRARWGLGQAPKALEGVLLELDLPGVGRVVVSGAGDDVHEEGAALLIDLGGADTYGQQVANTFDGGPLSWVVDVSGNDAYGGDETLWSCGAAFYGVAGVADLGGDDVYRTAHFGQGMGYAGVGILYDTSGDDQYLSQTHTQGVGIFGSGLLVDGSGSDLREVTLGGQGMGARQGIGWLVDGDGDDVYQIVHRDYVINDFYRNKWFDEGYPDHGYLAFSQGVGVGFFAGLVSETAHGGGIGVIFDGAGDDEYLDADAFGLGVGYFWGLGAVVDLAGAAKYRGWDYTLGSAHHIGVAFVMDFEGDDNYGLSVDHAQGHGLDNSAAMLLDFAGDDTYRAIQESQGTGVQEAGVGIMVDLDGTDRYGNSINSNQGWSREQPQGKDPASCFLDLGGDEDNYSRIGAENDSTWHDPRMTSVGRDLP